MKRLSERRVYEFRFSINIESGSRRLVISRRQVKLDLADFSAANEYEARTLVDNISDGRISYFGKLPEQDTTQWRERWMDQEDLPQLVQIVVEFPPRDSREWPLLIIAPTGHTLQ